MSKIEPAGQKIGYARVSTVEQDASYEAQQRDLWDAGCAKVYAEKASGAKEDRPQLQAALDYLREGDTLLISKVDRASRSTRDLANMVAFITDKGAHLETLDGRISTRDAQGKMFINLMAVIAEFERDMMLERQRVGIAAAKEAGKYKGRKPTDPAKVEAVLAALDEGMAPAAAAREFGLSRTTIYEWKKQRAKGAGEDPAAE